MPDEPRKSEVVIPRWLLIGLIDCHDVASPGASCEYVAEAHRVLAEGTPDAG